MARSVGDKLQSCTSSHSFVVTFVHKRCRLLLMSANSWEEAKCLICGWDDSLPQEPQGSSLCHAPVSQQTELCGWPTLSHRGRTIGPHCLTFRSIADHGHSSDQSIQDMNHMGRQKSDQVPGYFSVYFFFVEAEKIQLCWTEVCILTMTTLISLYFCFSILSAAFWRPKLLFYDWSANFNSLVDQIRCSIPTLGFRWMHIRGNEIRNYNDCRKNASVLF